MKKMIGLLVVVFAFAVSAYAPSSAVNHVNFVQHDYTISSSTAFDTLVGTADSSTLVTLYETKPQWNYFLVRDAITGGGSDSVKFAIRVFCYNASKTLQYFIDVDSCTAAAGEAIDLGVGATVLGNYFTIKAKAYADNGGEVILNRLNIWRSRPVSFEKKGDGVF